MITTLEGGFTYDLPRRITRDGKRYAKRVISAYAVRDNDLVEFWDATGPVGTPATYALGRVRFTDRYPAGRGRDYTAPWNRVLLYCTDWRGDMRSWAFPTQPLRFAPRDRVAVYREV